METSVGTPLDYPVVGPAIDRDLALSRVGGDADLLKEIAQLFLEDYPRALADLQAAVACGDARRIERAAHGLKGAVSHFGATMAVQAACTIEELGRTQRLAEVKGLVEELEKALAALRPELQSL
jgi:two-component system sensor histidine kinase/response regulator